MRSERIRRHVENDTVGNIGSEGKWRINELTKFATHVTEEQAAYELETLGRRYELWHYNTLMLVWRRHPDGSAEILMTSTGHGSVTDQQMMNVAFRALKSSLYFSRRGGSRVLDLKNLTHNELMSLPTYMRDTEWYLSHG